ncbi:MAG TPA: DUF4097 family beta strand repeat-containing protein [Myxococcota bacterium]|nr:DUF4097 family beta strand repeat-containing protein [Myxococcota bacterium]
MKRTRGESRESLCSADTEHGHGLGAFIRSLLAGIPWSERAERVDSSSYKAPRGGAVRIQNANGKTFVVGEERDDILVRACKRARAESSDAATQLLDAIRIVDTENAAGLELEVEAPRKWNRHGSANLEVRLPRALRVEVVASNGKISIDGIRSAVRARSSNGSVSVVHVIGDIEVHTSNAKVECCDTCGRLIARSSNGKIELEEHRGSIDASTSNGLIQARVDEVGREGILLATSNGRIVLQLPEKTDADVDLHVDNGVIRNDRNLASATRDTNGRVRGTLGRGGIPIKLRTSNGSICLR